MRHFALICALALYPLACTEDFGDDLARVFHEHPGHGRHDLWEVTCPTMLADASCPLPEVSTE